MALDVGGRHAEAERAYEWLVDIQRADGAWHNYYLADGDRSRTSSTPTSAPTSPPACGTTGCSPATAASSSTMWPVVERAIDFVLSTADAARRDPLGPPRRRHAVVVRAAHRLVVDLPRAALRRRASPSTVGARATRLGARRRTPGPRRSRTQPDAFEPKDRWAMDWYYPVLAGVLTGDAGRSSARRALRRRS